MPWKQQPVGTLGYGDGGIRKAHADESVLEGCVGTHEEEDKGASLAGWRAA